MPIKRKCSICKIEKQLDADHFHKDQCKPGGFTYICKPCRRYYTAHLCKSSAKYLNTKRMLQRKSYANPDTKRKRKAYANRPEIAIRIKQQRFAAADESVVFRQRRAAQARLRRLVQARIVTRPTKCQECKEMKLNKLWACLVDYDNPLNGLSWRCSVCFHEWNQRDKHFDHLSRLTVNPDEWQVIHEKHVATLAVEQQRYQALMSIAKAAESPAVCLERKRYIFLTEVLGHSSGSARDLMKQEGWGCGIAPLEPVLGVWVRTG